MSHPLQAPGPNDVVPGPSAAGLDAPPPATAAAGKAAPRSGRERFPALDGLRGIAALVVLVFHVLLVSPVFDSPENSRGPVDASWWITHTPLNLFWAGPQAVYVFFVLSGFVLALPAATIRWRAYYPQRLLRLYLPVWAAVALAVVLVSAFPRDPQPWLSQWWSERQPGSGWKGVVRDAVLVLPGTGSWNSPLWSLRYEMLFSLLLPLYLVAGRILPRWGLLRIGVLLVALAVAEGTGRETLAYLSMFGFGVLLAADRDRLAHLATRVEAQGRRAWIALAAVCVLLLNAELVLLVEPGQVVRGVAMALQLAGATLLIFLALHWRSAQRALTLGWVQWVGLRSFALYLVHEPIVLSIVAAAPRLHVVGYLIVATPVCLVAAHLFYGAVEVPAHRLSRTAGRRFSGAPAGARTT
ncbi:acyltransferase [uncultured Cellulomonas sp.]|uniref:acyltransferase family protein n=1 Tax=uncultured Cellulomonas sp. TaxID=189682 RepID=UPI00262AA345|nr:acyltransferase [uncultured Cellulomonas sp.]